MKLLSISNAKRAILKHSDIRVGYKSSNGYEDRLTGCLTGLEKFHGRLKKSGPTGSNFALSRGRGYGYLSARTWGPRRDATGRTSTRRIEAEVPRPSTLSFTILLLKLSTYPHKGSRSARPRGVCHEEGRQSLSVSLPNRYNAAEGARFRPR